MISIPFERTDGTYTLIDAIVLPDDHTLTKAQIEAIEDYRFAEYVITITSEQAVHATNGTEQPANDEYDNPAVVEV